MTTQNTVVTAVGDIVEQGANSAEAIHRSVAGMPFDFIEGLQALEAPLKKTREVHNQAIGAIYDFVRGINRDVQEVANRLIETGEKGARVVEVKARDTAKPRRAAAKA